MKLAVFDFDGTLFPKETLPFLLVQWRKLNYSKLKLAEVYSRTIGLYIIYKIGICSALSKERFRIIAVKEFNRIFKGMTKEEINHFFLDASSCIQELLKESVVNEIKKAKDSGYHTVILSGSYNTLLKYIAENLDIDTIIGTEMYFDNNDKLDFDRELSIVSGSCKVKKLKNYFIHHEVNWIESYAYADSYSDLELLELVGNPIAVNPDTMLKSIAKEKNWNIIFY